jgi:hypothetical protein
VSLLLGHSGQIRADPYHPKWYFAELLGSVSDYFTQIRFALG